MLPTSLLRRGFERDEVDCSRDFDLRDSEPRLVPSLAPKRSRVSLKLPTIPMANSPSPERPDILLREWRSLGSFSLLVSSEGSGGAVVWGGWFCDCCSCCC